MANFKSLKVKEKKYIFDFFDNQKDPTPAYVEFCRFPLPGETFAVKAPKSLFSGINFERLQKADDKEVEKLSSTVMEFYIGNAQKIDFNRFVDECVSSFGDFIFNGKPVKSVADFKALGEEVFTIIANDLYKYASKPDTFTAGELPTL